MVSVTVQGSYITNITVDKKKKNKVKTGSIIVSTVAYMTFQRSFFAILYLCRYIDRKVLINNSRTDCSGCRRTGWFSVLAPGHSKPRFTTEKGVNAKIIKISRLKKNSKNCLVYGNA